MQSPPGPEILVDGDRYLYFGGTSYLGLAAHPAVIAAAGEALQQYGIHSATSRTGFGTTAPLLAAETNAAAFFGTEHAFYFGSGYMGNHIMVAALSGNVEVVLVDDAAHYCVAEAARLAGKPVIRFSHGQPADLRDKIGDHACVLVMADAVGPVTGELAPMHDYIGVLTGCEQATLLLDDAHGFGVLGPQGRGLIEAKGLWDHVNGGEAVSGKVRLCVCGTLAKALGGFGGIIPGTREFVQQVIRASNYYDGASAPAPAIAAATAKALEIARQSPLLREQLQANNARLRRGLSKLGLQPPEGNAANFGISTGRASRMRGIHEALKSKGILVPYIDDYSGIPRAGLLRFAVFANHTTEQIDRLLSELQTIL